MKKFIFNLKINLLRKRAATRFKQLCLNEKKSLEELLEEQEAQKKALVKYAFEEIPFYKRHYSEVDFELGDMEQEGWFEKLPIITKDHLRNSFEEFTPQDLKNFRRISTTGGSTGVPTKCGYDGRITEEVYSWRLQSWYNVHPWDDHAYVWRDTRTTKIAKLKNALLWWPTKHLKLNASFITEEAIVAFLKDFNCAKPTLLQGYVGAVCQVAQYVLEHSIQLHVPKFVWVTSAPISPVQRKLLEDAFHAPVCDQYGSCEIRWIAQQCPQANGLHVNIDHVFLEFVDDANISVPCGNYGKTLLTNLEDYVFPMIRYENGDRGRWLNQRCSCGRPLPLIDSVKGRESESFVLPSGRTINGEYLTTIFDENPDIVRGFRVIQHKDLSITVEYIPAHENISLALKVIEENFRNQLDNEVGLSFVSKREISHDRGKLRFVIREK